MWRATLHAAAVFVSVGRGFAQQPPELPTGSLDAVYELLDRLLPEQQASFAFSFVDGCPDASPPCYHVASSGGQVAISATGANELAAGLGHYFREYCNMTIGWTRGGGSNIFVPSSGWPEVTFSHGRIVPWSYAMNVCTHSYTYVWYSWEQWTELLDWMALSGINNFLAMTGQEEVAYKVFAKFGLTDAEIRHWFNGPALLTWSRGQNEYGAGIAGPLPRSFMKAQWELQVKILARARSLGMVGQLPGFQGNVPVQLKYKLQNDNMTDNQQGTAWIDALDPLFGQMADMWMETMIGDFGTDHWYQLDGYFDGGTAPWLSSQELDMVPPRQSHAAPRKAPPHDPAFYKRGTSAYQSLNRTDPDAIWSFQGWAINDWYKTEDKLAAFRGFVDAVPHGKFNIIDMFWDGRGEWRDWVLDDEAFFGARFIWTTLHNFGGTNALRGNLSRVNEIPFAALPQQETGANVWGTGFTPEGTDQNPVIYEFITEQNWRSEPVADITERIIDRSHRRYGLAQHDADVSTAWSLLTESSYTLDQWGQDTTGVGHMPGTNYNNYGWQRDSAMPPLPTTAMCKVWSAWGSLISAAEGEHLDANLETFRYDLVNTGREILAQLTLPFSMDFAAAYGDAVPDAARIESSGNAYISLLADLDELVATDSAFQIGPWIEMARALAAGDDEDCVADGFPEIKNCADFYEWNARVHITTWDPTRSDAEKPGKETVDYAPKHWSGLIRDYYLNRVKVVMQQALASAAEGRAITDEEINRVEAKLAYEWTTALEKYPTSPVGDAVAVSKKIRETYQQYFAACSKPSLV